MAAIEEIHDLYRVEPAEFVETRAALVKQLRGDGRKDDARAVVKLRKPTAASWALNQVAYDQPELIAAALDAGDALRDATTETLGGDATNLRAATAAERDAAGAVIDAAGTYLPSLTADHRERMSATLRAAAADDEVRDQLVDGLLAADHEPPAMGFAAVDGAGTDTAAPARSARAAAAELAAPPRSAKRKVRRVGTPSKDRKPAAVDEVDQRRRAKEADAAKADRAEQRRAKEAERERARQRKRRQAELDTAARKARDQADKLEAKAVAAEEAAAAARSEADAAITGAEAAEAAATAGPPD